MTASTLSDETPIARAKPFRPSTSSGSMARDCFARGDGDDERPFVLTIWECLGAFIRVISIRQSGTHILLYAPADGGGVLLQLITEQTADAKACLRLDFVRLLNLRLLHEIDRVGD